MILKGKTQKGKNRIRENGQEWQILQERNSIAFSDEVGPWVLIVPINNQHVSNWRWIHKSKDKDFEVISQ